MWHEAWHLPSPSTILGARKRILGMQKQVDELGIAQVLKSMSSASITTPCWHTCQPSLMHVRQAHLWGALPCQEEQSQKSESKAADYTPC